MKILYLLNRKTYETKMSRVRFHGIEAIKRYPGVNLKISGPGFDGFRNARQMEKEFRPDLVVWYKPLNIPGFQRVKTPKCLRYNEMWDTAWTKHEIKDSKSELVICHHFNDIKRYAGNLSPKFKLIHNPHCGEVSIFQNYNQKKDVDVLLTGVIGGKYYPLRTKVYKKVKGILRASGYSFKVRKHPKYKSKKGFDSVKNQVIEYAKDINRARITITCASTYKYALAKYVEIPLSHSLLCGDIPGENQNWYKSWMLPISNDYNAQKIADILIETLKNRDKLEELTHKGWEENLKHRKQEDYARRFVKIAEDFLSGKKYDFAVDSEKYYNGGENVE